MWDKYILKERIGAGGMGEVFRAYNIDLGAVFAVKRLNPDLVRRKDFIRFQREIRHLSTIRHPHIVRIVDVSDDPARPGYAMELCSQGDVSSVIAKRVLSQKRALVILRDLLSALDHLHSDSRRIVHRDIKPGNVLIGDDKRVKLSDFGLSVALSDDFTRVTSSNWFSPGFSPPEQPFDMASVDERGDIYALGAVIYHLLTRRDCRTPPVLDKDEVGYTAHQFLSVMLHADREKRPRAAAELLKALPKVGNHRATGGTWASHLGVCPKCGSLAVVESDLDPDAMAAVVSCMKCDYRLEESHYS